MTAAEACQFIIDLVEENKKLKEIVANHGFPQRYTLGAGAPTGPSRPNRSKLTEFDAKDIRAAHQGGMKQSALARSYNVHHTTISRTVRRIYH